MRYISFIPWVFIAILSVFFFQEYFELHKYYAWFLTNPWVLTILIVWLIWAIIPVFYLFYTSSKKSRKWLLVSFFIWFIVFSLAFAFEDSTSFIWPWFFIFLFNFLLIFSFFWAIIVWSTAVWNILLRTINFKESIYNFAIKTWFWLWVLWLLLFYLSVLGLMNSLIAFLVFAFLLFLIFIQRDGLKTLFISMLWDFQKFIENICTENKSLKYIFMLILLSSFLYIYFGFVESFIPYPSAWDANHAYMFIPKIIAQYGWYPWHTDFRPAFELWTAFLSWIYNLWFFTSFSQDTWMTSFNFLSWVFSLFFWFMLISTLLKLIYKHRDFKYYSMMAVWYALLISWLTSWMWAFLVFVDNKTDLALLMFVILWLFLATYSLFQQKSWDSDKKEIYIYFAIAWFFFWIASFIKPTANFDIFWIFLLFWTLNIWVLSLFWWVLFVIWFLYYLKDRWFDKLFDWLWAFAKYVWFWWMISWFFIVIASSISKFIKDKSKVLAIGFFALSFVLTLFASKWFFMLNQAFHWDKIIKSPSKIAIALALSNSAPIEKKDSMTWSLYEWIAKKAIWSSYNEDNGRYVWFWNKTFTNPWRAFLVPDSFKKTYSVYFSKKDFTDSTLKDKLYMFSWDSRLKFSIDKYVQILLNNKNDDIFQSWVDSLMQQLESSWQMRKYATDAWISWNLPDKLMKIQLRKRVEKQSESNLRNQIKQNLSSWKISIENYPQVLNTKSNRDLLLSFEGKTKIHHEVSIPYSYLVPFNMIFNRSLQNHSSYYTDIWIVWLLLFIISIFAFIYSFFARDKIMWAFAFSTLAVWWIWYGVASWIIWYNIWWIVWLILVSILYINRIKDKWLLSTLLILISVISIILNFSRISYQSKWFMQFWYKSWVWKTLSYELDSSWTLKPVEKVKIPFNAQDFFDLQFKMYKKSINAFENRNENESWIIWWTYMRYFIKNQNKIINDQFLKYLWKLFSDYNVENSYKRLKDQKIKEIVIDPNIASVVQWDWNKSLWYRYYWTTDSSWNIENVWVIPMFVNLSQSWKVAYTYSNNLWIKYALTVPDDIISKLSWKTDPNEILELRYRLAGLKFLSNMISNQIYIETWNLFYAILNYRIQEAASWRGADLLSDLADINSIELDNYDDFLKNIEKKFNSLSYDKQLLFIEYNNILQASKDQKRLSELIWSIIRKSIWASAQLLHVHVR